MLYVLDDGSIKLTRGDTATISINIVNHIPGQTDTPYVIQPTDILELSIKKSPRDTTRLVHKTLTGENSFKILPADTKDLEFGRYLYDVQITTSGDVYTVIEPKMFEVMKEVT